MTLPALTPRAAVLVALAAGTGCFGNAQQALRPPTPVAAGINPADLVDPTAEADARMLSNAVSLYQVAERIRADQKPAVLPPKKSVLALSGGGSYGAYSAGILVGWSRTGTRPTFDTVTGISTGALIAPLAFLGPAYDEQLAELYTTVKQEDLYTIPKRIRTLLGESLADNTAFVRRLEDSTTPALLAAIAAEHHKGRRLYMGTTDLDGKRQVIWDMGAIAARGTPADLALFRSITLASASIPGFFPPVRIPVAIDGKVYEERHVDGGMTASVFFQPPWVPPAQRSDATANTLYNTDLYIVVAGKLYADPEPVRPRSLRIAAAGVSSLIYAETRGDLFTLYTASVLTGMNYHVAAVPAAVPVPFASTDFDPVEMVKLYQVGLRQVADGTVWRRTPPGLEKGEGVSQRAGVNLTRVPGDNPPPLSGPRTDPAPLLQSITPGFALPGGAPGFGK